MKRLNPVLISALFLIVLSLSTGCRHVKHELPVSDWKTEVGLWEHEGWNREESLGVPGEYIMSAHFKSDTAQTMKAFWNKGGVRLSKEYAQKEKHYLILTFSKSNSDSFAVVLSKKKAKQEQTPSN